MRMLEYPFSVSLNSLAVNSLSRQSHAVGLKRERITDRYFKPPTTGDTLDTVIPR